MMNRQEEITDSIPIDLINEILTRLPAKSIARFRCVSKLWGSILDGPYFRDLFLTMSKTRPRILFVAAEYKEWIYYSWPAPHSPYDKSTSFVVAVDFQIKFPSGAFPIGYPSYSNGLILKKDVDKCVILNPSTGEYVSVPEPIRDINSSCFLGFDPIDKQFKALFIGKEYCKDYDYRIMTLGTKELRWRKIQGPLTHQHQRNGVCINGVLYYVAQELHKWIIVCFDVRCEKFNFIHTSNFHDCFSPYTLRLINYKGKLGVTNFITDDKEYAFELNMWVLEDVEKQIWSKNFYTLTEKEFINPRKLYVEGVTSTGEIVLSNGCEVPRYVYYFSPERNILHTVEVQGFRENHEMRRVVHFFGNHVEDLNNNICSTVSKLTTTIAETTQEHIDII